MQSPSQPNSGPKRATAVQAGVKNEANTFISNVSRRFEADDKKNEYIEMLKAMKRFEDREMNPSELCQTIFTYLRDYPDLRTAFERFVPSWVKVESMKEAKIEQPKSNGVGSNGQGLLTQENLSDSSNQLGIRPSEEEQDNEWAAV